MKSRKSSLETARSALILKRESGPLSVEILPAAAGRQLAPWSDCDRLHAVPLKLTYSEFPVNFKRQSVEIVVKATREATDAKIQDLGSQVPPQRAQIEPISEYLT